MKESSLMKMTEASAKKLNATAINFGSFRKDGPESKNKVSNFKGTTDGFKKYNAIKSGFHKGPKDDPEPKMSSPRNNP